MRLKFQIGQHLKSVRPINLTEGRGHYWVAGYSPDEDSYHLRIDTDHSFTILSKRTIVEENMELAEPRS
jgi:hypothetical protein